ncbi:11770_t:CDS:2 [Acaulospora morrowiae]|uniref:11770_t:CDS:1 n=1 Tax=Acaulospora morrowiae TaxID=94023 RepID=A0A9N8W157_9GLOM|nr:11770_t:CDS:2 [Acaulospora morrowiae]
MFSPKEKSPSSFESASSFTSEGSDYFSPEKSDALTLEYPEEYEQNCLLFPTYATKHVCNEDKPELTDNWNIRARGWAFSTPRSSKTRALFLKITSLVNKIPKTDSRYEHLQSRTPLFWASNLDNKEFFVEVVGLTKPQKMTLDGDPNDPLAEQIAESFMPEKAVKFMENIRQHYHGNTQMGDETYKTQVVSSSGCFSGDIVIPQKTVRKWLKASDVDSSWNMLKLEVYQNENARPAFGVVNLIEPTGVSVISDIDDTIKETAILAGPKTIFLNTFLQPFKEVPGMSELYRYWYDKGVVFHYVSNSPWQLFPALRSFFQEHNFPQGSAHLKFYELIKSARDHNKGSSTASKKKYITELLKDFPERKFILIGDTGERDPELYAEIAEEYKDQIIRIFVRDVNTPHLNSQPDTQRAVSYTRAFKYFKKVYSIYGDGKENGKETEMVSVTTESTTSELSNTSCVTRSYNMDEKNPPQPSPNRLNLRNIISSTITNVKNTARTPTDETGDSYDPGMMMETESNISEDMFSADSDEDKPKSPRDSKIESFNKRIRDLQERFEEGFFSTFSDPDELRNDPIIRKYLKN